MFHINMMQIGAWCRQYTTSPFLTQEIMFQKSNSIPRRQTVNAVVVMLRWSGLMFLLAVSIKPTWWRFRNGTVWTLGYPTLSDEYLHNTHWKLSLLTCWKICSVVHWYHCRNQLFWRRMSGPCRSCGLQLAGCSLENHRISEVFCRVVATCPGRIFDGFISDWQFRIGGWGSCTCCRKNCVLCMQVISGQLVINVCCTRFLNNWFLVVSSIHLTPTNPKNDMDFVKNIGWDSACLQRV